MSVFTFNTTRIIQYPSNRFAIDRDVLFSTWEMYSTNPGYGFRIHRAFCFLCLFLTWICTSQRTLSVTKTNHDDRIKKHIGLNVGSLSHYLIFLPKFKHLGRFLSKKFANKKFSGKPLQRPPPYSMRTDRKRDKQHNDEPATKCVTTSAETARSQAVRVQWDHWIPR